MRHMTVKRFFQWLLAIFVLMPMLLWVLWVCRPINHFIERVYRKRVPEARGHYSDPKFGDYSFGSWRKFTREMWNGRPDPQVGVPQ